MPLCVMLMALRPCIRLWLLSAGPSAGSGGWAGLHSGAET